MDWLQSLGPAVIVMLTAIFTIYLNSRSEELRMVEEKLNEERRRTYTNIINPMFDILVELEGKGSSEASETYNSCDYRKSMFNLILIGSDGVILAHNRLLDYAYSTNAKDFNPDKMMNLIAKLHLEIRKSIMRNKTKLNEEDMRTVLTKDILGKKS